MACDKTHACGVACETARRNACGCMKNACAVCRRNAITLSMALYSPRTLSTRTHGRWSCRGSVPSLCKFSFPFVSLASLGTAVHAIELTARFCSG